MQSKEIIKKISLLFEISFKILLCSKGGMSGFFFPLKNDLRIDQYVLVLVIGLYNLDARFSFYQ